MITPEQIAKNGSEHAEQAALMQWCAITANALEQTNSWRANALRMLFAIPNGDQRGDGTRTGAAIAGARLKAEGQRSGVPDLFLPVPRFTLFAKSGLFIEMKARKHRRDDNWLAGCSKDQIAWIARLGAQGYQCVVCYGWQHASETIEAYLT